MARENPIKDLEALPRQDILAIANSLHAICKAKVESGYKPTPAEQDILDRGTQQLAALNRH